MSLKVLLKKRKRIQPRDQYVAPIQSDSWWKFKNVVSIEIFNVPSPLTWWLSGFMFLVLSSYHSVFLPISFRTTNTEGFTCIDFLYIATKKTVNLQAKGKQPNTTLYGYIEQLYCGYEEHYFIYYIDHTLHTRSPESKGYNWRCWKKGNILYITQSICVVFAWHGWGNHLKIIVTMVGRWNRTQGLPKV